MYEKFEQLLQERNVTPYRVAKETGISTATLSDWKNGKSEPKKDKIKKIAEYFDVPITLFYEDDKPNDTRPDFMLVKENGSYLIETVAAHKEEGDWTQEELKMLEEYKKLLLAARNNKK
jgi:transcriptional regulator with XRE-family HTH domain